MPKILISISILFLTLSAVFGVMNANKAHALRDHAERTEAARAQAEQAKLAKEKELKAKEVAAAAEAAKNAEVIANAEADLVKSQTEKSELQAKLQSTQNEIADLRTKLDEAMTKLPVSDGTGLPMPGADNLQVQLEETRHQLESAEREKQVLADKIREVDAQKEEQQRRRAVRNSPGLRGTVLAVNQAYNFVVLNLGARQGVEANSELLILRGGSMIGRIRISSVEPATAIGDIISSSLPRGVQVQPGDTVIYAGTSS